MPYALPSRSRTAGLAHFDPGAFRHHCLGSGVSPVSRPQAAPHFVEALPRIKPRQLVDRLAGAGLLRLFPRLPTMRRIDGPTSSFVRTPLDAPCITRWLAEFREPRRGIR